MKKNADGVVLQHKEVVDLLNRLLSDYQIHYQNLRGFHWNIKGRAFFTLHAVFEQYYNEMAQRIDQVAERILMLGSTPLHTYRDYLETGKLKVRQNVSEAEKAIDDILNDVKYLLDAQRKVLETAEASDDDVTADTMTAYNAEDEKKVWMLSAYLA